MKKEDLARELARQAHLPEATARDQVDRVIYSILKSLRHGKPVSITGLGRLVAKGGKR